MPIVVYLRCDVCGHLVDYDWESTSEALVGAANLGWRYHWQDGDVQDVFCPQCERSKGLAHKRL